MNELAVTYSDVKEVSTALAQSGYFSDVDKVSQAIVKVIAGRELGLPPFAAMTGIHIIHGRPAMGANVIATLIKNDPRYDYRIRELSNSICKIEFFENGESVGMSDFSAEDAEKAQTKNMNKFPRNMLFARAISNGARWYTPGIFGGAPVYTPDELGLSVDEEGYIDAEIVEVSPASTPTRQQVETFANEHGGNVTEIAPVDNDLANFDRKTMIEKEAEPGPIDIDALLEGQTLNTAGAIASLLVRQTDHYKAVQQVLNALDKDKPKTGGWSQDDKIPAGKVRPMVEFLVERIPAQQPVMIGAEEVSYE